MYKSIILCMLINFGWHSIASEQKSIYLVDLFPVFKSKELCNATERLLKSGVDPNYRPSIGHLSPLMWAMENKRKDLVELLVRYKANPYHVITSLEEELCCPYQISLYIASNTPWRKYASMMGDEEMQKWFKLYINNSEN